MLGSFIKKNKHIILLVLTVIATIVGYTLFLRSPHYATVKIWAVQNQAAYFLVLSTIKTIGIVWPPLPGGTLSLASIPIVGWEQAYLADLLGSTVGSAIAFWLGKKYGYSFLKKFLKSETVEKIKAVKIVKNREVETIIVIRLTGGGFAIEILAYAAGILELSYGKFLVGTTLAHMLLAMPIYFLVNAWYISQNILFSLVAAAIFLPIFFKFRSRYFE